MGSGATVRRVQPIPPPDFSSASSFPCVFVHDHPRPSALVHGPESSRYAAVMLGRGFAPSPYPAIWLPDNALARLAFGYFSHLRTRSTQQHESSTRCFVPSFSGFISQPAPKRASTLVTHHPNPNPRPLDRPRLTVRPPVSSYCLPRPNLAKLLILIISIVSNSMSSPRQTM